MQWLNYLRIIHLINFFIPVFSFQVSIQRWNQRISTSRLSSHRQVSVWVEEAEDGFVDEEENLMTGEKCVKVVKAFATDPDDENDHRFLCAGALIKRPDSDVYDAWMADSLLDEPNTQFKGALLALDYLFAHYLEQCIQFGQDSSETTFEEISAKFFLQCGSINSEYHCASNMAARERGFRPIKDFINASDSSSSHRVLEYIDTDEEDIDSMIFDVDRGVSKYSSDLYSSNAISILNAINRIQNLDSVLE